VAKWIYTPEAAIELTEAIKSGMDGCNDQLSDILLALEKCVRDINSFFKGDNNEIYDFMLLIDGEALLVRTSDSLIAEMGFHSPRELVEGRLEEFYNICDKNRVWISPC